jgi:HEPN domain-containing protein
MGTGPVVGRGTDGEHTVKGSPPVRAAMTDATVVDAGEHDAEDLLGRLHDGERLVVRADVLGRSQEVTLRFDGETYYCDTPTTLHKHETAEEMAECMRKYGYVDDT